MTPAATTPSLIFIAGTGVREVPTVLDLAHRWLTHATAPDHEPATPRRRSLLADVLRVFAGESWMSWQAIAGRLREQLPEHHPDVTAETVSAQLRTLGVPSVNGKHRGRVLKGAKAAAIEQALRRQTQGQ